MPDGKWFASRYSLFCRKVYFRRLQGGKPEPAWPDRRDAEMFQAWADMSEAELIFDSEV